MHPAYRRPRARILAAAAATAGLLAAAPAVASGTVAGRILGPAGVTPIASARVTLYHLATSATFTSEPTDAEGAFSLTGLPRGRYDLSVTTARGLWMAERPLELSDEENRTLSLSLRERAYWEGADQLQTPDPSAPGNVVGKAVVLEDSSGDGLKPPSPNRRKIWWSVGAGLGVLGLALLAGDDSDRPASPFTP